MDTTTPAMEFPELPEEEKIPVPLLVLKPKKQKLTKAQRKERRLKALNEFKKLEIRDRLRRELELSRKSARRGREQWENLCKEVKIVELREELTEWENKVQRVMEQKDNKINRMIEDIEFTHEMNSRCFVNNLRILDYMKDCYNIIAESSKTLYENQVTEAIQQFYEELYAKQAIQDSNHLRCENIMFTTNLIAEQQLIADYEIFQDKRDEYINIEGEKRFIIREGILEKMKELHTKLTDFIDSIFNATTDSYKYERIQGLMDKQRTFFVESKRLTDLELHQLRIYGNLQRVFVQRETKYQRRFNDLRLEFEYFTHVRKGIERKMSLDRDITFEKLKLVTTYNYERVQHLNKYIKYGELLLSLAATCRKLQLQSEKVVDWCSFQAPQEAKNEVKHGMDADLEHMLDEDPNEKYLKLISHLDLTKEGLVENMSMMRHFWRRHCLVEAQKLALLDEKRQLMGENEKYINFIKSLSKADDVNELTSAVTVRNLMPSKDICEIKKNFQYVK